MKLTIRDMVRQEVAVAPRRGAWIETKAPANYLTEPLSRAPQGRVD